MPVLGSSSATVRGVSIPDGSLDTWRAARSNHAIDRPEVVFLGDSTWWGQVSAADALPGSNFYSVNNVSPIAAIRAASAAAGFTDGGPGAVGLFDSAASLGIAVDPVDRGYTAAQGGSALNLLQQYSPQLSTTTTVTYRTRTTQARVTDCHAGDSGTYTYSVNGAASVTRVVSTSSPSFNSGYVITGMTAGVDNTIAFTNVSGNNRFDVDFLNATGIVYHKQCVPGATASNFVTSPDDTGSNSVLNAIVGTTGSNAVAAVEDSHPIARKVRLAVWTLGINDINSISAQVSPRNAEGYLQQANLFVQAARNAGADPVLCLPHWKTTPSYFYTKAGALMGSSFAALARSNHCPFLDLNEALGGPLGRWPSTYNSVGDAHLKRAGYAAIGSWVWANLLNA